MTVEVLDVDMDRERWQAHQKQAEEARKADAEAAETAGDAPAAYSSDGPEEGALASDEALQALRDKLTGDE